jgi:hypothetical protein
LNGKPIAGRRVERYRGFEDSLPRRSTPLDRRVRRLVRMSLSSDQQLT